MRDRVEELELSIFFNFFSMVSLSIKGLRDSSNMERSCLISGETWGESMTRW